MGEERGRGGEERGEREGRSGGDGGRGVFSVSYQETFRPELGGEDEGDAPSKEKGPCLYYTQGPESSSPLPLSVAQTGRNNLNEEITPLLPTGVG